jgi:hypothetical protein
MCILFFIRLFADRVKGKLFFWLVIAYFLICL